MKHQNVIVVGMGLWLSAVSSLTIAQEPAKKPAAQAAAAKPDPTAADIAAIRAGSDAFIAAFNKADAKAIAALWTEDGEYIDDAGRHFVGRAAIEKGYAEFFAANPDAKIQVTIDSVRLLSGGAALEDGHAVSSSASGSAPGFTKYTVVHVKVHDKWFMASVRDAWIETPASVASAADLEWLVGTWIAEDQGVKTESVISWGVAGRFLERRYTTTQLDGTTTSGLQLIGWNPLEGHVQSWTFSPDGGHAVGVWLPQQDGWIAQMRGTSGDGALTTAVNILRRLDDNAYVWQSVQRTVGNSPLPDTGEVIWKRQPASR